VPNLCTNVRALLRSLTTASALCLALCACNAPRLYVDTGSGIDLAVTVPSDVKVRELTYQVLGNGIEPLVSTWATAEPQHQFETLIPRVPPGNDYHLTVTAKSVDGKSSCVRETTVSVQAHTITHLHAALSCSGGEGTVVIHVGVACTKGQLATYTVSPLAAAVGGTIALTATPTAADADALDFLWTAPSGAFDDAEAAQTTYRCEKPGHIKLNLFVGGSLCQENHDIEIDCLDARDAGGG
jgi:hypothetical protein